MDRDRDGAAAAAQGGWVPTGMALFLSTFVHKVDKRGRVSVPPLWRKQLEEEEPFKGIVAYPSVKHPALEASGIDRVAELADSLDQYDLLSDELDDLQLLLNDAPHLPFATQGRGRLPPAVCPRS